MTRRQPGSRNSGGARPSPCPPCQLLPSPALALRSGRPFWHQGPNTSVPSSSFSCPKRSPLFLRAFSSSLPLPFWSDSLRLQWDCSGESRSQGQRFYILQWKCSVGPGAKERGNKHPLFGCKECKSAPSLEGKVAVCNQPLAMCVSIGPASPPPMISYKENSEIAFKCMYTDPKHGAFFLYQRTRCSTIWNC